MTRHSIETEEHTRRLAALKVLANCDDWVGPAAFADAASSTRSVAGKAPTTAARGAGMTLRGLWMRGLAEREHRPLPNSKIRTCVVYRISKDGRTLLAKS